MAAQRTWKNWWGGRDSEDTATPEGTAAKEPFETENPHGSLNAVPAPIDQMSEISRGREGDSIENSKFSPPIPSTYTASTKEESPIGIGDLLSTSEASSLVATLPITIEPFGFVFNVQKVDGKGEDADPIAVTQHDRAVLAVFDGMGGAGSTAYLDHGIPRTGAYLASRLAASELKQQFSPFLAFPDFPISPRKLKDDLLRVLQTKAVSLEADSEPSRLKSTLIRRLPTTMAALYLERKNDALRCQALWAGDSRCYALSPHEGLQQLTFDDLKVRGDALANLRDDSPLSNCLNADGNFEIRATKGQLPLPVVMLAVTDGCFSYLYSPAHFEFLLVDTLQLSRNAGEWRTAIVERLRGIAGDDCSMALLAVGWTSFTELREAFQERHRFLRVECIEPLDFLTEEITQDVALLCQIEERKNGAEKRREALREEIWSRYKAKHDRLLPTRGDSSQVDPPDETHGGGTPAKGDSNDEER